MESKNKMLMRRLAALRQERSSWMANWEELFKYFTPRGGHFPDGTVNTTNRGAKKHAHLYDNSPLYALNIATAGLMTGTASPARPWFLLRTPDDELNQSHRARVWLANAEQTLRDIMLQSNTYRSFRRGFEEVIVAGTEATHVTSDFNDVIRHYPITCGEYMIGMDAREEVSTLYRQFEMTVEQIVERFGLANVSKPVQDLYDKGDYSEWVSVVHGVEPRRDRDPLKFNNKNFKFGSYYMELNTNEDRLLSESGFRRFPFIVARWKLRGHDAYGESPCMEAIGDNKQLQQEQYRKGQAIDYQTQPPLQVPSSLRGALEKGPGGITFVDNVGGPGIKSAWDVPLNLNYLLTDIQDVRHRIDAALFVPLFLMFSSPQAGVQPPTAEEVAAKREEQLLMAGPILENLHNEKLEPAVRMAFFAALESGVIPPPPEELSGQVLHIKFVSTLAQAQRLVSLGSVDRIIGTIVNLAAIKPEAIDKLDADATIDYYSDVLGIDPDLIVGGDKVAIIRQERAKQQQQAAQMAAAPEAANTAKTLGDTNPQGLNAAVQALQSLGGNP